MYHRIMFLLAANLLAMNIENNEKVSLFGASRFCLHRLILVFVFIFRVVFNPLLAQTCYREH